MTLLIRWGIPPLQLCQTHIFRADVTTWEAGVLIGCTHKLPGDDITASLVVESDLREVREILKINSQRWWMKQLMSPHTTLLSETRN